MLLVERDWELEELGKVFEECRQGGGRLVLVNGPCGGGKTSLLERLGEQVTAAGGRFSMATGRRIEVAGQLGIVERLFRSPQAPVELCEALDQALEEVAGLDLGCDFARQSPSPVMTGLVTAIAGYLAGSPGVICVDDTQYADAASLQVLSLLLGRIEELPLLLVLVEPNGMSTLPMSFQAEARRVRRVLHFRLNLLSRTGTAQVLAGHVGGPMAERLADEFHELTGGNPLLVSALVEECGEGLTQTDQDWRHLTGGDRFTGAVLACTYHGDSDTFRIASCLAVLGAEATVDRVARLADVHGSAVVKVIRGLSSAGLVTDGRLRQPELCTALLVHVPPTEVAELHLHASRLLYDAGLPVATVARHLIAADVGTDSWACGVLLDAATEARDRDDLEFAVECLDAAAQSCSTDADRAVVKMVRCLVEQRNSPQVAHRSLESLVAAVRAGDLRHGDISQLVMVLAWNGRLTEARECLDLVGELDDSFSERGRMELQLARERFELIYPPEPESAAQPKRRSVGDHRTLAARTIRTVFANGGNDQTASVATSILDGTELNERTIGTITDALYLLVFSGRPDAALLHCEARYQDAVARGSRTWQGLLAGARAFIAMRQGDHVTAEGRAKVAFAAISPAAWGAGVAAPLAACVTANVALGKIGEAAKWLNTPVPEALFQSRFSPLYQYAWGEYHLADGRPEIALEEFLASGERLVKWNMDVPSVLAWRISAAEACLALGDVAQARQLLESHDRRPGTRQPRIRAAFLRVLAATKPLKERPALLQEALTALAGGTDRSETIRVLADLGQVLAYLGMSGRARSIASRAWTMAREAGLEALCAQRLSPSLSAHLEVSEEADTDFQATLSQSELAVAKLAALEHTNREISRKLNITVSTVEQHLTRVYKKLGADGRHEIAILLQVNAAKWAVPE